MWRGMPQSMSQQLAKCLGPKGSLALSVFCFSLKALGEAFSELPLSVLRLASQKESRCSGSLPGPFRQMSLSLCPQALVLKMWSSTDALIFFLIFERESDPNDSTCIKGSIQRWIHNLLALLADGGSSRGGGRVGRNGHWVCVLGGYFWS